MCPRAPQALNCNTCTNLLHKVNNNFLIQCIMEKKNQETNINLHFDALIQNLVIVNTETKETSETIAQKVSEALLKAVAVAQSSQVQE